MNIRWFKKLSREARHLSVEDLLLYLDGEAEAKRAGEIRGHLESCWGCRARREKIERAINDLVEFSSAAAPRPAAPSPQARNRFLSALKPLAEEPGQAPFFRRGMGWLIAGVKERIVFQPALVRLLVASIAVCLIVVVALLLNREPAVSARELIERATKAESQSLAETRQPVVYQKIQARRIGDRDGKDSPGVTLEVWRDIANQRMRQRVDGESGALFTELEQILRANGRRSPLSVSEFSAWRNAAQIQTESVGKTALPDGTEALRLVTVVASPRAAHQIVESELIVRARDWHPVSESLKTLGAAGTEEYEFTEAAYLVVALGDLNPAIFHTPAKPVEALAAAISPVSPSPTAAPATAPSAAELAAAEFDARYRLHQMQADLEGNIQIESAATGVLVSGIVDTAERKEELINALGPIAHVSLNIQTTGEAARALASRRSGAAAAPPDTSTMIEPESDKPATQSSRGFQQKLAQYFERRLATTDAARINAAVAQLSNEAVSLSASAMAEAWAMRRLAERYSETEQSPLSPADRQRLDQMLVTHARRIGARIRRLQTLLAPVLADLSGDPSQALSGAGASSSATDWAERTQAIFNEVKQLDRLSGELLIDSKEGASVSATARAMLVTFARLLVHLENIEQMLHR
ncbi:MAG: hypothetical protein AB7U82_26815 [Blastocatellales bacterium]